jgi:biopolymer transport protein ExbD
MAELNASSGKSAGKTSRKRLDARVDLTAMVDLAFLLITFFIMTTTLMNPKMVKIVMPDKEPPEIIDDFSVGASRTMTIVLGNHNQAVSYLGMTEKPLTDPKITSYGKEGIRQAIVETVASVKKKTGKDLFVIIKPSNHSVYENLVNTLDEVHIAGAGNYAIEDITAKEVNLLKQKKAY